MMAALLYLAAALMTLVAIAFLVATAGKFGKRDLEAAWVGVFFTLSSAFVAIICVAGAIAQ